MPYTVKTKDGITIPNIPDELAPDSADVRAMVAKARADRGAQPITPNQRAQDLNPGVQAANQINPAPPVKEEPRTTAAGVVGAANRALLPYAGGAALGAAVGAPIGGVGAVPGAAAGVAAVGLSKFVADPIVSTVNSLLGTKYTLPTDALEDLMTKIGIPEARTQAERIVQTTVEAAAGAGSQVALGQSLVRTASNPVVRGAGSALASQPAAQIASGGGAGAASQGAKEAGAGPVGQLVAGLGGSIAGGAPFVRGSMRVPREMAEGEAAMQAERGAARTVPEAATVAPAAKAAVEPTPQAVGTLIKKASGSGMGSTAAKNQLAEMAAVNTEAKAAADRMGIELPPDVFSDNPQIRAAAGLTRSAAGSPAEGAWRTTVTNAVDKADEVIKGFDATFAEGQVSPGVVSEKVRDTLQKTRADMNAEARKIYDQVDAAVPKATIVQLPKLRKTLEAIRSEVGEGQFTPKERMLLKAVSGSSDTPKVSNEAWKFDKELPYEMQISSGKRKGVNPISENGGTYFHVVPQKYKMGEPIKTLETLENEGKKIKFKWGNRDNYVDADKVSLHDNLAEARDFAKEYGGKVVQVNIPPESQLPLNIRGRVNKEGYPVLLGDVPGEWVSRVSAPAPASPSGGVTYGGLIRLKNEIGEAIGKGSPFGDIESASLKRLYGALAEDQLGAVEAVGGPDLRQQLHGANLLYAKERALGKRIVDIFGKDFEGSLANKMRTAISDSSKGGSADFAKLMKTVPDDLKKEVVATALASATRSARGAEAGGFGFSEYAKVYRGLRANAPVYKQVVESLGPGSHDVLRDLYEVSRRITDARAAVLTTGKANQALSQAMRAEGLVEKVLDSTVAHGLATGAGAVGLGPVGAALSGGLMKSLTSGRKQALEAAGELFSSEEFQKLLVEAATQPRVRPASVNTLVNSPAFRRFARVARLPQDPEQRAIWVMNAVRAENSTIQ